MNRPTRQEATRFVAINSKTFTSCFEALRRQFEEQCIASRRLANFDNRGSNRGKEAPYSSIAGGNLEVPNVFNANLVEMMACISASVETGPRLLLFKGTKLAYRKVFFNGQGRIESLIILLPRNAVVGHQN